MVGNVAMLATTLKFDVWQMTDARKSRWYLKSVDSGSIVFCGILEAINIQNFRIS